MPNPWIMNIRLLDAVVMNVSIISRFSVSFGVPLIPRRWNLPGLPPKQSIISG